MSDGQIPSFGEATAQLIAAGSPFELEEVEIRGRRTRTWKNCAPSIRALWEASRSHGDRCYLVYEDERYSYEETFQRVAAFATDLATRYGVVKGERVAIYLDKRPEAIVSIFGNRRSAPFVPAGYASTSGISPADRHSGLSASRG